MRSKGILGSARGAAVGRVLGIYRRCQFRETGRHLLIADEELILDMSHTTVRCPPEPRSYSDLVSARPSRPLWRRFEAPRTWLLLSENAFLFDVGYKLFRLTSLTNMVHLTLRPVSWPCFPRVLCAGGGDMEGEGACIPISLDLTSLPY